MPLVGSNRNYIVIAGVGVGLGVICIVAAVLFLPENCLFFEHRQVGFLCDAFIVGQPRPPCPVCSNELVATIARIVGALGIGLLLLPASIFGIRKWRDKDEVVAE